MPVSKPDEIGVTTRSLRRKSGVESASPAIRNSLDAKSSASAAQQNTPSARDLSLSPVISTRSLRSAARSGVTSPVQMRNSVSSQGDTNSRSNKSTKSYDGLDQEMQPPARSTRLSMKQQSSPDQPEQSSIVTRRSSLRQPAVKAEVIPDEPSEMGKSLRSSSRRKSNVDPALPKLETSHKENESKSEGPNTRRSNRRPSGADNDKADTEDGLESPTASRSLRSALKVKLPSPPQVKARKEGNLLIISGIKDFPADDSPSLRIKLKTSFRSDADDIKDSGRKRRRGQNDDADIKAEEDSSPRKRMKEAAVVAEPSRASRRSGRQTRLADDAQDQLLNGQGRDVDMQGSFETDKGDEQDSRARRAARRSAVTEALKKPGADAKDDDAASSSDLTQLNDDDDVSAIRDDGEATRNERSVTPPSSIPPDEITEDMLPSAFLDRPTNPLPESAYQDKAAFLHAQRFLPLPDLKRFIGPLSSHSPAKRSTETLLKLAYNTQQALEAWQDEYIILDEKTCAVGHSQPKKPAKGGRVPLSNWKWQENLEKDLFGDGSILAYLAKSRQPEAELPAKRTARKARRGEVDMLAGVTNAAPAAGRLSMVNGNPDDDGDGGRTQRARRQPKRFEEVMAEAEPSKRRKRGAAVLDDSVRNSAPPAVVTSTKRAKRGAQNKTAPGTETDEEEGDGVVKPQWTHPPRPKSSVSQVTKQSAPPAAKAQAAALVQSVPLNTAAAAQGRGQPAPQPSTAAPATAQAVPPESQPPPSSFAYPGYGYYTPWVGGPQYPIPPPRHFAEYPQHPVHPLAYQHQPGHAAPGYYQHMYHPMHYPPPPHHAHAGPQPHPHAPPHIQPHLPPQHPLATSTTAPPPQPQQAAPTTTKANAGTTQPKGQLPRRRKPALGPNGQPHEKSETRSASMTLWWAERKKKLAAQKEAAAAAERAGIVPAPVPGGGAVGGGPGAGAIGPVDGVPGPAAPAPAPSAGAK